ncbi:MAG TPA: UDP-N-acetylglucosamine 4,6-dehydratase (inverting) [Planctomycetes bacterium]|nr:UDP-N-acetylglucosamine 4,6-dehydratase (inverting) [Planctomycetota bacterium]
MSFFDGKTVLVTGGTGSFGKHFIKTLLTKAAPKRVVVYSRDELKQYEMQQLFRGESRLRFFLGDVRDMSRLQRALHGVNLVVHAAALKQVPAAEYNPFEAVKTNIHGAQNIIEACIDQGVERVIALSTDKASSPINLYGATKLVSDKLFVSGNAYAGGKRTRFAVVRYGNVVGSRGSVVPLFKQMLAEGASELPITDERMTRFWITLDQGVSFVMQNLEHMWGGEIFVPKIPSMKMTDLARAMSPSARIRVIGIRPGEKLHEEMINVNDARHTRDLGDRYAIIPDLEWFPSHDFGGKPVAENFAYTSDANSSWLTLDELRAMIA